ncbi:solute carrier family 35 member B1 isoform X2 [Lingula anatina]|uniref:Solute carrier family 35 member B1 isoform X1 n=1 Tax=Lingula anatina TaxID=7574 RepID=A0A1S3HGK1_LINAN|nr:solute carrier family 35 member B1 isoform X1 [Lingula anatina]XP_013385213.1 solute carrier family 35 member B1 isoform X2 [Lingula anatina]|eukprot:XP_013385212.1 solute carrier family 35 member B1 isoform X1 [Lingula anatina]
MQPNFTDIGHLQVHTSCSKFMTPASESLERGDGDLQDSDHTQKMQNNRFKLAICAGGIFVCYFYYGIIQESVTKGKYGEGENQEKFTFTLSLVFMQCIINALFAQIAISVTSPGLDKTPSSLYAICSLSYLGAMLASNHSLQHIPYPTQVLGKSVKPIPVMILGVLVARKRYPLLKYLFVLMIVTGVALFMYKDKKPKSGQEEHSLGMGEILLLVSLTLDGLTGGTQDKMRSEYSCKSHAMMFNVNIWSVLWLTLGWLLTGEATTFIGFAQRHPSVLMKMFTFSVASALGQNFIFITVTSFGPLTCSIITTTRKFFTILGSVLIFGNPMVGRQWIGTVLVFIGLFLDSKYGKEKKVAKS